MATTTTMSVPERDLVKGEDFLYFGSRMSQPWSKLSNFYWTDLSLLVEALDEESILYHHNIAKGLLAVQPRLREFMQATLDRYHAEKKPQEPRKAGVSWPSSEHLWQSLKATNAQTFARFLRSPRVGDLADWSPMWLLRVAIVDKGGEAYLARLRQKKGERAVIALTTTLSQMAQARFKRAMAKGNMGLFAKLAVNPKYAEAFGFASGDLAYEREQLSPQTERACWLSILRLKFDDNKVLRELLVEKTTNRLLVEMNKEAGQKAVLEGKKPAPHWGGLVKGSKVIGDNVMGRYLMELRDELVDDDDDEEGSSDDKEAMDVA
jgi:predicted NAD-dependent protein-ADP-ribosyltransferase YbiA (DUF1768 family)